MKVLKNIPKVIIKDPPKMWQPDPRYTDPSKLKEVMEEIIKEQQENEQD